MSFSNDIIADTAKLQIEWVNREYHIVSAALVAFTET